MRRQQAVAARQGPCCRRPMPNAVLAGSICGVVKQQRQGCHADQVAPEACVQPLPQPVPHSTVLRLLEQQRCRRALGDTGVSECQRERVVCHPDGRVAAAAACRCGAPCKRGAAK